MKAWNTKLGILLAAISLMGVGCGKSNSFETNQLSVDTTATDNGVPPTAPNYGGGTGTGTGTNTASFTPVSFTEFSNYVALHALNNPSNFKVTVDLTEIENQRYAGTVKISYTDAGQNYVGTFTAGSGRNIDAYKLHDNNVLEANYNYWYVGGGKTVFSGFFQDQYGAIILIVDNYVNQGDGQGGGFLTGSIYYKNFAQSYYPQQTERRCWFIYNGPYNCRASAVINKSSLTPADGYRKLGTFSGLNLSAAFKK